MLELFAAIFRKISNDMSFLCLTPHLILVRHKSFQSHRSTRVNLTRTDTYFRTESIPETIRKPRARIHKNTSRIYALTKGSDIRFVFGHDGISVMGRVRIDPFNRGW